MLNCYDKILKKHIESFLKVGTRSIMVYGLQNEETQDSLAFSQAGDKSDRVTFPLVTLVRLPSVEITDDAMTKRPATYEGFLEVDDISKKVRVNCMRCTLSYYVDIVAENRKTAEDIGLQLYFRLRTHPNFTVTVPLPVKNEKGEQIQVTCMPDIVMDAGLQHMRPQTQELSQYYKFRLKFDLKNVNIFDYEFGEVYNINYSLQVKLNSVIDSVKIESQI